MLALTYQASVWVCEYAVEVTSVVVIVGVKNEVDGTEIFVLVCSDTEGDSTDVVTIGVEDDTQVHSLSEDKGMIFTCLFIDLMVMRM